MPNRVHSMLLGTGAYIPKKKLTNQDLEKIVDTSDQWILERTGIKERHIIDGQTTNSDMAAAAAVKALADADLKPEDIDRIIVATVTGDVKFPSVACLVQDKIGAINAAGFDVQAACSGFIFGLSIADGFISAGTAKNILVIGSEILSKITDWKDRSTCVLFGDAAGAAVIGPATGDGRGVLATFLKTDGRLAHLLHMPGGGTKYPPEVAITENLNNIKMLGPEVFKAAVTAMGDAAKHILDEAGITTEEVDLLIPHQANKRIIDATARRIKLPPEKVYMNLEKYGNTSAASIPVALNEAREKGLLEPGALCVLVAFGGGLTWGSAAIRM